MNRFLLGEKYNDEEIENILMVREGSKKPKN